MEWQLESFSVSTDRARLDVEVIHAFLKRSYWATDIPREVVVRSLDHSLCFGLFHQSKQIGFARMITDYATFAYLADVFVHEEWRGQGLSKFLMRCVKSHPDLQGLRRWLLFTADAHGLYRQFGFTELQRPERAMELTYPDVYRKVSDGAT